MASEMRGKSDFHLVCMGGGFVSEEVKGKRVKEERNELRRLQVTMVDTRVSWCVCN